MAPARKRICRALTSAALALCAIPAPALAQQCLLYAEGFTSFNGPASFDNGSFKVQWCEDGATVTTSSFCPFGSAYRTTSDNNDPMIWVYVGDQPCTRVILEFNYSQFFDSLTFLTYATSNDDTLDCNAVMTDVAGHLDRINGLCTTAIHEVTLNGAKSVYWTFDHGPTTGIFLLDNVFIRLETCDCNGTPVQNDCCEPGDAGCIDPAIEACVCAIDPYCCEVEWDAQCVAEVSARACGTCTSTNCLTDFTADFGTFFEPGSVCVNFPELFESCEGLGPWTSSGSPCASAGDQAMYFASGLPHSAAITKCISLADAADASLVFEYSKNALASGPVIEISTDAGFSFTEIWAAPFASGGSQCTTECIDLTAWAGLPDVRFRFASGSVLENGASFDDIQLIRDFNCASGPRDCNANGIDDAQEVALDPTLDHNANAIPDGCDIASGDSPDANADGIPDETQCITAYSLDENLAQDSVGLIGGGELLWLNAFTVIDGAETISSVSWSWGDTGPADNLVTVILFDDPTNDANPDDATVLWQTTLPTYAGAWGMQRISVPEISVGAPGDTFFIGILARHTDTTNPAALEAATPVPGRSWAVGDATSIDTANLLNNELPPILIENAGLPGNWTLRAGTCNCTYLHSPEDLYTLTTSPADLNADGAADHADTALLQHCIRAQEHAQPR